MYQRSEPFAAYPYYHELQLSSINDYYKQLAQESNSPEKVELNSQSQNEMLRYEKLKMEPVDQTDLFNAYKMANNRCRRTSYNSSFAFSANLLNETGSANGAFANSKTKRNSGFTDSIYSLTNQTDNRKTFWRPKTPGLSVHDRNRIEIKNPSNVFKDSK
jgi:hypothetical protein